MGLGQEIHSVSVAPFLGEVLPENGLYCATTIRGETARNVPARSIDDVLRKAREVDAAGQNAYFAPASFQAAAVPHATQPGKTQFRVARNARAMRSFWLDIDVGEAKAAKQQGYATREQALAALIDFCRVVGLPAPLLVSSGAAGLHVYWPLDRDLTPDEWLPAARRLKALCHAHHLLADPSRTSDAASVLRVPGTHNHKHGGAAPVELLADAGPYPAAEILAPLLAAEGAQAVTPGTAREAANDALLFSSIPAGLLAYIKETGYGAVIDAPPADFDRMKSALATIQPCCDRDQWRKVVWAIHDHDGPANVLRTIALEWSQGCPEKFKQQDFDGVWSSFEKRRPGGITAPSLYQLARGNGWHDGAMVAIDAGETQPAADTSEVPPGDVANSRQFAAMFRGQLLYSHSRQAWLRWDDDRGGKRHPSYARWCWCGQGEHMEAAKMVAKAIYDKAIEKWKEDPNNVKAREAKKAAEQLITNVARLQAMLKLATSEPGISVASDADLDADPWLLGVENGVLDLRTGKLLAPDPKLRITRIAGCAYTPGAECPRFMEVLYDSFDGDAEMIGYFWRFVGYILTGSVREEKMFFGYGAARSGKSLITNVLVALMGGYATTIGSETLSARHDGGGNQARDDVARMAGARLISANETRTDQFFDDALIKSLVSTERVTVRFSYGKPFEFTPTGKIWLRGNNLPGVRDASEGLWRRMDMIEFKHPVDESRAVPDLHLHIIAEELSGILNRSLERCLEWQRKKLRTPRAVLNASAQYRADTDLVGQWIEESTQPCGDCMMRTGDAYASYRNWAARAGLNPMSKAALGRDLRSRRWPQGRLGSVRAWTGVRLVAAPAHV